MVTLAWGNKNRSGARRGSKSGQFKKGGGGTSHDGRCPACGGVEGRHNQVRETKRVPKPGSKGNYMNKVVTTECPNA